MHRLRTWTTLALALSLACPLAQATNPADYPLELTILRVNTERTTLHNHGFNDSTYNGSGQARLVDHDKISAADFTYVCDAPYHHSQPGQPYKARWKKQGSELEIITEVIGKPGAFHTCNFKVTLRDGVYMLDNRGEAILVPLDEYKRRMAAFKARQAATPAPPSTDPPATTPAPDATTPPPPAPQ